MVVEVIITVALILVVAHILYHKVIKNVSGGCGCCCNKDGKSKKKCTK